MSTAKYTEIREGLHRSVGRTVVGYDSVVDDLMIGLLADGHVLIEGVPGVAKTTLAKTFASVLALDFQRIQFTQDLLPSDITGHSYLDQQTHAFGIRKGPVFTNVLLADELNRAPPKTQSALLEAMEEQQVTIEGDTLSLPDPFLVIATMNPIDIEGVYGLPEAQLDRFMLRTRMEYLDAEHEKLMMQGKLGDLGRQEAPPRLRADAIAQGRRLVQACHVHPQVVDYMHRIGATTREHDDITLGASPRALEQFLGAARAHAVLRGRAFVTPDDVKAVAHKILDHRLVLEVDAELRGATTASVVQEILAAEPVPTGLR